MNDVHNHEQPTSQEAVIQPPFSGLKPVKSADRVLDILETLGRTGQAMTLSEISRALGMPKSSTHQLLQTLASRGYLETPWSTGRFRLGPKVLELGSHYARQNDLLRQFPIVARRLVEIYQDPVQMAVLDGTEVLYIAREEDGTTPVRFVTNVGSRLPAHSTGLGKVLLAALSETELAARLSCRPLEQVTPNTITTFDRLVDELSEVRTQGFAIDNQEVVENLCCFAAPVRDPSGRVVAAISLAVPSSRVDNLKSDPRIASIKDAAAELSRRTGFPG